MSAAPAAPPPMPAERPDADGLDAWEEPPPTPASTAGGSLPSGPPLHTPLSRGLVLLALGTGALGLALGNPVLLALAATVAVLLHAARAGWPGQGEVRLDLATTRTVRGRAVDAALAARVAEGPALYWVHARLAEDLALEHGANLALAGPGEGTCEPLRIGCPKRGAFPVGPATLTAVHPHLLAPATLVARAPPVELVVDPRLRPLRRAKPLRGQGRQRLGDDRAARGFGGSDFRELREYERGDALKAVNWKATARRSTDQLELMVNEHEPEARKHVWFFLDLGAHMEVGTTLDNALEDAIEATLALTHHFVSRGHRVGGTTFNAPPLVFYPESGTRQQLAIARGLARAAPGAPGQAEGLPAAVERVRGFLARERPLVFVVTRPEVDPAGLRAGAQRAQRYAAPRRPPPVYVLAPRPRPASPEEALAQALRDLEAQAEAGSAAVRVLPLRHGVRSLDLALAKGVLAR